MIQKLIKLTTNNCRSTVIFAFVKINLNYTEQDGKIVHGYVLFFSPQC